MGASYQSVEMKAKMLEKEKEKEKEYLKYKKVVEISELMNKIIKKHKNEKKYNLNIIYYDEHLRDEEENSDNCSFIEMNINGTFYGCHNFKLFKLVCEKIKNNQKQFILISSGSAAKKIYDYCSNINEIREYFIYCWLKDKYMPLMDQYPKLRGVYNDFSELKEKLYDINEIKMDNIQSSNLIMFED